MSVLSVGRAFLFKQEQIDCNLTYPTGERVLILSRVLATVSLGKFCVRMRFFVANVEDECILGENFLSKTGIINGLFESIFGLTGESGSERGLICSRIGSCSAELPHFLSRVLEQSSPKLNKYQKRDFSDFLSEFCGVFSEDVIAGNCDVLTHAIKLCDSRPIKQVPRRIPLHL